MSKPVSVIGIIGGTALTKIDQLTDVSRYEVDTPYGKPSSELTRGAINGRQFLFLARHGVEHTIPPHQINYRANIWALREAGVSEIIAISSVGGITDEMSPGSLVVPDQLIDYTWGREHTFFDKDFTLVNHIEFSHPYDEPCRQKLMNSVSLCDQKVVDGGIMGITQGPRLETIGEVQRMMWDGCDMIGMTGMPEAALARELEIPYAILAVVVNWAAGVSEDVISMDDIERVLDSVGGRIGEILLAYG